MSCSKKYETYPEERTFESDVFDSTDKSGVLSTAYLLGIYSFLPDGFNRIDGDFLDAGTDDAIPSSLSSSVNLFTNGQLTAVNYPDNNWSDSYTMIRRANVFIKNIPVVPIPSTVMLRQVAEARFLRAFAYFELLKRYGGVPLVGDTVFNLNDDLNMRRNNYEQCVNYIVSECDQTKVDLPKGSTIVTTTPTEFGRATAEAAMALKLRVLLYAASPLFNGGGFESDPQVKALTGYPTADPIRWERVVEAAEELISGGYYKLPSGSGTSVFMSVFTTKLNTDIIFSKQSANSTALETNNAPVGYVAPTASNGRTSPTQEFLNAFLNQDGSVPTEITLNASQYANRDPRLNATVFYNGMQWLGRAVETFEGGLDKPNAPFKTQTRTSYYLRKFLGNFATSNSYSNQSHNFPYFRFAEVLLSYAEALNELGRVEDAQKEVIKIRARAGITAGSGARYGIPVGISQNDMRNLIRNERRIELAFEEHRFWDIRRWKIAPDVLSGATQGLSVTPNTSSFIFELEDVSTLRFEEKYYHMPIPYSEITKNSNLVQNEGYY